jgi:pyruvate/2-oxoglutarate/acetoin dehydrogenase E1 component
MTRDITYAQALSEGLVDSMESDSGIFVTGIAVDYESGIFGTTSEALRRFGKTRVFDAPAMENGLTGIAIGAAAMGKRAVIVHPRNDFMFLAMDELINLASKWRYMYAGNAGGVPFLTRAIVGRGWGQGATHSQSLHAVMSHFPGLYVGMPSTPYDAKEMTMAALRADAPTILFENRALYNDKGAVPEKIDSPRIGGARILREGKDVTIVATSVMVREALTAADALAKEGISAMVVDPRWVRPLDKETLAHAISATGHLVCVDTTWELCGLASEIAALAVEYCFNDLKAPVRRLTFADCPAPVSAPLEDAFYPKASTITRACLMTLGVKSSTDFGQIDSIDDFKGPY